MDMASDAPFRIRSVEVSEAGGHAKTLVLASPGSRSHPTERLGGSIFSIVIGRNGAGKSRLLRDLKSIFHDVGRGQKRISRARSRTQAPIVKGVSFSVGEQLCKIGIDTNGHYDFASPYGSGFDRDLLPSKIIGLSFTPFDKLPAKDDLDFERRVDFEEALRARSLAYVYLGFKSSPGRLSAIRALYRSIELAAWNFYLNKDRRSRIESVFETIGYLPQVQLRFELFSRRFLTTLAKEHASFLDNYQAFTRYVSMSIERGPKRFSEGVEKIDKSDERDELYRQLFDAARHAAGLVGHGSAIDIHINFSDDAAQLSNYERFRSLRLLNRYGLLTLDEVNLTRSSDSVIVNLREASSGELHLISGFLGLAAVIDDNSLVLVDEPENSLHPEWQRRYIELLNGSLYQYSGCHYIVSTHSPIIMSGAARHASTVVSLDGLGVDWDADSLSDQSPDLVLVEAFKMVTKNNNYVRQLVLEALHLASNGKTLQSDYRDIVGRLSEIVKIMPSDDALYDVVRAITAP